MNAMTFICCRIWKSTHENETEEMCNVSHAVNFIEKINGNEFVHIHTSAMNLQKMHGARTARPTKPNQPNEMK